MSEAHSHPIIALGTVSGLSFATGHWVTDVYTIDLIAGWISIISGSISVVMLMYKTYLWMRQKLASWKAR